jgi:quercetin dioxygenase-like cupin family protein
VPVTKSGTTTSTEIYNARFTPASAPSLGGDELAMWTVELAPGEVAPPHHHDRELLLHLLTGRAEGSVGGTAVSLRAGDTLSVPPGAEFALGATGDQPARALACSRAGMVVTMADGATMTPPWTV